MIEGHERALLQFSGGKDSTALLYQARPWLDRIEVVFAEAGATFPHVRQFVEETCAKLGAKLTVVEAEEPLDAYHARVGFPSDVLPYWSSPSAVAMANLNPKVRLQEPLRCCAARLWEPMQRHVRDSGTTLVLRGSKKADTRVGVADGTVEDGVEYRSPLWGWTDADVLAYLEREGVDLPRHYREGAVDSLDCASCTAHLPYHGREKLAWMKAHTPELFEKLKPRLALVSAATADAYLDVAGIMQSAGEG